MLNCFEEKVPSFQAWVDHFYRISWGCRKKLFSGFKPCFSGCSTFGKRNRYCRSTPGGLQNVYGEAGLNVYMVNPLIPETLEVRSGDESAVMESLEEDYIEWAQLNKIDVPIDHEVSEFYASENKNFKFKRTSCVCLSLVFRLRQEY